MQLNDIELNTQLSESSILNIEGSERYCTATFERAWSHYTSVPDVEMLAAAAFQAQDDSPETIVKTMKIPRGVEPFSKFPIGDGVVSILPTGKQATRSVDAIWSLAHKGRVGAVGTLRRPHQELKTQVETMVRNGTTPKPGEWLYIHSHPDRSLNGRVARVRECMPTRMLCVVELFEGPPLLLDPPEQEKKIISMAYLGRVRGKFQQYNHFTFHELAAKLDVKIGNMAPSKILGMPKLVDGWNEFPALASAQTEWEMNNIFSGKQVELDENTVYFFELRDGLPFQLLFNFDADSGEMQTFYRWAWVFNGQMMRGTEETLDQVVVKILRFVVGPNTATCFICNGEIDTTEEYVDMPCSHTYHAGCAANLMTLLGRGLCITCNTCSTQTFGFGSTVGTPAYQEYGPPLVKLPNYVPPPESVSKRDEFLSAEDNVFAMDVFGDGTRLVGMGGKQEKPEQPKKEKKPKPRRERHRHRPKPKKKSAAEEEAEAAAARSAWLRGKWWWAFALVRDEMRRTKANEQERKERERVREAAAKAAAERDAKEAAAIAARERMYKSGNQKEGDVAQPLIYHEHVSQEELERGVWKQGKEQRTRSNIDATKKKQAAEMKAKAEREAQAKEDAAKEDEKHDAWKKREKPQRLNTLGALARIDEKKSSGSVDLSSGFALLPEKETRNVDGDEVSLTSRNTSLITLRQHDHIQQRAADHGITLREMQHTKKHGDVWTRPDGRREYADDDRTVIGAGADGKDGVTVLPRGKERWERQERSD